MARADRVVGDAGLAGRGDGRQRVERVVLARAAARVQPASVARAAAHARAELGIEDGRAALDARRLQHEVGVAADVP